MADPSGLGELAGLPPLGMARPFPLPPAPSGIPQNVWQYMNTGPSQEEGSGPMMGYSRGQTVMPPGWQYPTPYRGMDVEAGVQAKPPDYMPLWNQLEAGHNRRAFNYPQAEGQLPPAYPPQGMVQLPDGRWVQPPPQVPPNWQDWLKGSGMGGGLSPMSMSSPAGQQLPWVPYRGGVPGTQDRSVPPGQGWQLPGTTDANNMFDPRRPGAVPWVPPGGADPRMGPVSMHGFGGLPPSQQRVPLWADPALPLGQRNLPGSADRNVTWPPRTVPPGWPGGEL